jgi:SAM-dependent methyltransferase
MATVFSQQNTIATSLPADEPTIGRSLRMVYTNCCICEHDDGIPIAIGEDFEYRTSADTFLGRQCRECGLVYLNPRPHEEELDRIYPSNYHAFEFSEEKFGLVFHVRRRLEARRLLKWCRGLESDARILDVGCGDGFHLGLLREFGPQTWRLEGVDNSSRAVEFAHKRGLTVHQGRVEQLDLPAEQYDLAFMIQTIEHVENPHSLLVAIRRILRPGGRLVIVTDNTGSLDFRIFKGRHWGGYHFPRHWNLFNSSTLKRAASKTGFEVETISTAVSPVNWVYSVRNLLVDLGAPKWVYDRFSLQSPVSLAAFTLFDAAHALAGKGALLNAVLRRPRS